MNWISNFFSRYWRNVHFITIAVIAMVFIYNPPFVNQYVSNGLINVFQYPFFKLRTTVTGLYDVSRENERLTTALVEASLQLSKFEEERLENQRLRLALDFDTANDYNMVPAKIVSLSSDAVAITAVINKGSHDSIKVNQPVVNELGLIGKIINVSDDFATVQLLTDPANRVASRVRRSRDMGIAKYQVGKGMLLDNFQVQGDIVPGDTIVSSGLGEIYPEGLRIGTVLSINREPDAVFCVVRLASAVNFERLDEIFVIVGEVQ